MAKDRGGAPVSLVGHGADVLVVILGELQADCSGKGRRNSMAKKVGPLLARVDELQHLAEKLGGAAVPQGLGREVLLSLLEGSELVSYQESVSEVVVAFVAWSNKDVGHPAGRRLSQDGGDECKGLLGIATQEGLGL